MTKNETNRDRERESNTLKDWERTQEEKRRRPIKIERERESQR